MTKIDDIVLKKSVRVDLTRLYQYKPKVLLKSQTCNCKKGSDWLKRWVEAQHNFFLSCKVFHDWSKIKLGKILYLLDGYIFAVLFETTSHCFC